MKPQALQVGGWYRLTTHRWKQTRVMEFLRKDPKGFLVFALTPMDQYLGLKGRRIEFEQKFRQDELLTVEEVVGVI